MADLWYIARAGKKVGPHSTTQMNQMAGGGELLSTDMVLLEGAKKWMPASEIKGLFPATSTAPTQLPLIPVASEAPEWHYIQNGQQAGPLPWSQLRQIADSGQLRLTDMVWKNGMPAWAAAGSVQTLFPSPVAPASLPTRPPSPVAGSSPPVLASAETGAWPQTFSTWYANKFGGLNIAVHILMWCMWGYFWIPLLYLLSKSTQASLTSPDTAAPSSEEGKGQEQGKGAAERVKPTWQAYTTPAKAAILGGAGFMFLSCFVCCGGTFFLAHQDVKAARKNLEDANTLWVGGEQAKAVEKYKSVIHRNLTVIPNSDRPLVFQRVIEFEAGQGNTSSAKALIEKALEEKIRLALNEPKAKEIMAQAQAERKAIRLAKKKAKADEEAARLAKATEAEQNAEAKGLPKSQNVQHAFFTVRPGFDYYYKRHWTIGTPDSSVFRRHNADGSVDAFVENMAKKGAYILFEKTYYRIRNGNLESSMGVEKEGGKEPGRWHTALAKEVKAGDSWKTDQGAIVVTCTCEIESKWERPPDGFGQYAGNKLIQIRDTHTANGVKLMENVNVYVEEVGLIAHEFCSFNYTENLIEVRKTR